MQPDDIRQRHDRLERLRKLGVHRGADHLKAATTLAARGQGAGSREQESGVRGQESALSGQPPILNPQSPIPILLPGEPVDTPFGPAWVRTERYPLAEHPDLAAWLRVSRDALAALGQDASLAFLEPARAIFLDTETTGLSIGTGTYTFMIGMGTYEDLSAPRPPRLGEADAPPDRRGGGAFVVRQYFMRHPGEERAQLHLVEEALGSGAGLVSFNGRGFDMPLVQSRFVLARMPLPLIGAPHLDLLPPARRVWRARIGSCRLGSLEQNVLGVQRSVEDVPGYLIPDIYREYYRTGVATEMLVRVFYHNLLDITSMPILAARLARHFELADPVARLAGLHPLECASLGRCYASLDWVEPAIAAYRAALAGSLADAERAGVLRDLAYLLKRLARREEAAAVWEEWIGSIAGDDLTPYGELAKHHEWYTLDHKTARGWVAWALRIAEGWPPGGTRDEAVEELRHRLERLERKLAENKA
ncbi:MAG: ribonuclease H-like domain-containing protein [Chloroflexi bacterium]|nr:ribonuclease H-like domain-containing protein [Chloroflexota bacterium]